jgi:hypothetical protein
LFLVFVAWLLSRRSGEELLLVERLPGGAAIARRLGSDAGRIHGCASVEEIPLAQTSNLQV